MTPDLLTVVAVKAVAATVLALAATFASRWVRRPALLHALWVVVLLELLVPPLLEVGVLPSPGVTDPPSLAGRSVPPAAVIDSPAGPERHVRRVVPAFLFASWIGGAAGVVLLAWVRVRRFARSLPRVAEAPECLRRDAARLAGQLGLRRCPPVRVVPAILSPMLRPRWGTVEVLFPAALLDRLAPGERVALLAHELAHVRRRDHWVRWLELAAAALFWWHPVVWWARRRLRDVEERCCDGLVLETLPDRAHDYARGLVKTVEFLAGARHGLPVLASGVAGARDLKERLTMIVERRSTKRLSAFQRGVLVAAAGALLLVLPTHADREPDSGAGLREEEARLEAAESEILESMMALERRAAELEAALDEVRARRHELESGLRQRHEELELRRLEEAAERSEAAGDPEAAESLRLRQAWMREQLLLEAERARLEAETMREHADLVNPLRQAMIEAELARHRGELGRAADLESEALQIKLRLEQSALRRQLEREKLDHEMHRSRLDRMRSEILRLDDQGQAERSTEARRELELLLRDKDLDRAYRQQADRIRALQRELELLEARHEEARAEGLHDEAAALAADVEELQRHLRELEARSVR